MEGVTVVSDVRWHHSPLLLAVCLLILMLSGCGLSSEVEQHYNSGVDLAERGRFGEAVKRFTLAVQLDPEFTLAYNNRGLAYYSLGEYRKALEDFDRVIRLDPELGDAYANRALAKALLGNLSEAEEDLKRAEEQGADPDYVEMVRKEMEQE